MGLMIASMAGWWGLDILTKTWAQSSAFIPYVLLKNGFYFTLHHNAGIAFGIAVPRWIQIVGSLLLMTGLGVHFWKSSLLQNRWNALFLGMILGGGVGNLLDRILTGSVVDFIYLYPFPVFNVADIGITIGLILFVLYNYFKKNISH